ncbi:cytochrome P450 71D10-like [Neltuma alba]|uniref:cytochrome P450 71D10-like n=1 Tax=Neltuma alba TaxID=207710 RepID=UPI0010A4468D|nr:cytochrome P450 71D10-like [Prosopis alba]
MEVQVPISFFFTFFCFFIVVLSIVNRPHSRKSLRTLPPGPWKIPLIGNLHQFVGSLPHHSLRKLANKYGPLMHLQLGETSNIVISSPEMAKEIMKTHDAIFSNRPYFLASRIISYNSTNIGFSPYGSYWRHLRKICTVELLSANRVQSFSHIREEEVSALVRKISANEGSVINLSEYLFSLTTGITSRAAFGKKCGDHEAFLSTMEEALKLAGGFSVSDLFPSVKVLPLISGMRGKLERLHRELDRILENIVKDHKEEKRIHGQAEEDLVDVLLKLQQQNDPHTPQLTDNNIKAVILDIFGAGTDTSSTTLEWAMSEMLKNPKVMEEAQAEVRKVFREKGYASEADLQHLKYLKLVVKETLRLHPPAVLLLPRENTEKCKINGYEIPAKTRVIVNAWAIGRDPMIWNEAERFRPERFVDSPIDFRGRDFEYIPFGGGRRICPGITFATALIEQALAQLLYHFNWKLPNEMQIEEFDMTESFGSTVRRKDKLLVIPIGCCN